MMNENEYAVIEVAEYYGGDVQHPRGWDVTIAADRADEELCIGTLTECREWYDELNDGPRYLGHGMAGNHYRIVEIVADSADYQEWLDSVDWDGCPNDDDNYEENCEWAEDKAYTNKLNLYVAHPRNYYGIIIDLSKDYSEED